MPNWYGMLDTSARLLQLLALFQSQRYWSGCDLSQRLDVTPRTLRRDIDRLRSLGYPVNATSGAGGGYQLGAGANLPPLLLDDDEAVAVAVGLRTAASGTVNGIEEASVRALAKVQQVLPVRLRQRVAALQSFILPLGNRGPNIDSELLSTLATTCRDHVTLRFDYLDRDKVASSRQVEPHRLVHTGRRWYLVAWDSDRADWRTFRLDRIQTGIVQGRPFPVRQPPEGGFVAYATKSVAYSPQDYRARVVLLGSVAEVAERLPPEFGTLEAINGTSCILETGASSLDSLSVYLALLGMDFQVLEPPELIERVRWLGERFARATRTNP